MKEQIENLLRAEKERIISSDKQKRDRQMMIDKAKDLIKNPLDNM